MQTKVCYVCRIRQPVSAFYRIRKDSPALQSLCKTCSLQREKTPEKKLQKRSRKLHRKYGITHADYEALLAQQGGECAICGRSESWHNASEHFVVDHDHASNRVRGLLCDHCNRALGLLQDSEEILEKAISYLRQSRS